MKARVSELEKRISWNKNNYDNDKPEEENGNDAGNAFGEKRAKKVKLSTIT